MLRRRRLVAALALLAVVSGACAKEADRDPLATATTQAAGEATTTTLPDGDAFTPDPIDWSSCGFGECATLAVPLDYAEPGGDTIDIFVARTAATGDRIGSLFVNPGGPGAGGADFAATLRMLLPEAITDHFDIVGVDPRGTGRSTPLDCGVDPVELYGVDPTIEDAADRDALLTVSEAYSDDCGAKYGDLLTHVGTRDVARDMDTVRAAMGDAQMSYLGFSYGTAIGQVYADLFPDRVRAMVLDGVLELGPSGLDLATEQAAGFETALSRWVEYCQAGEGCATAANPLGAVEQVLALVERPGGIPAPSADRPAGPGEASLGLALALYSQSLWGPLDHALSSALDGDGSELVALADQYIGLGDFEVYFAVNCLDFSWPTDPQAYLDAGKAAARQSPHFGEALVLDYVRCASWPAAQDPLDATAAPGTPPIVVISTTGDPATPYQGGVTVAHTLEHGVLVTNEGEGHTVVADGKPCIDDLVTSYLVELVAPADGTTC